MRAGRPALIALSAAMLWLAAEAPSAARPSAAAVGEVVAMGPGMMRGGMMGGYGNIPGVDQSQLRPGDLGSRAGKAFAQTCAQCHVLPDPRLHAASQWPGVVDRMELHMKEARLPAPDADRVKEIDAFLEQHASDAK